MQHPIYQQAFERWYAENAPKYSPYSSFYMEGGPGDNVIDTTCRIIERDAIPHTSVCTDSELDQLYGTQTESPIYPLK